MSMLITVHFYLFGHMTCFCRKHHSVLFWQHLIFQVFNGNSGAKEIVKHGLKEYALARFIRFVPTEYYGHKTLRVEVYGVLLSTGTNSIFSVPCTISLISYKCQEKVEGDVMTNLTYLECYIKSHSLYSYTRQILYPHPYFQIKCISSYHTTENIANQNSGIQLYIWWYCAHSSYCVL